MLDQVKCFDPLPVKKYSWIKEVMVSSLDSLSCLEVLRHGRVAKTFRRVILNCEGTKCFPGSFSSQPMYIEKWSRNLAREQARSALCKNQLLSSWAPPENKLTEQEWRTSFLRHFSSFFSFILGELCPMLVLVSGAIVKYAYKKYR